MDSSRNGPRKKLIDSGGSGSKPSFYLNLKPNLNPLLDLNGDYSFENDWDMITGTDVRITLEQMKNSMDIESIAPKFELKGGLISLEHTQSWPAKITFFGGTKVENITKIKININPGSEWSISSDGTSISYQKGDLGISINNKGELVINNGRGTTEIKEGGYNLDRYTHWIIEGGSNNFFNVKTSSKSLIFSSNWLPFKEVAGGYIPFAEYSVEVSDKQGYISLTNQTTISIHRDIRDFAYFALGGVIGYEGIELVNRLLSSGYRRPAVGY